MGVTGDFARLGSLARKLREIDRTVARTPSDLAKKAAELTRLSAASQRTPEGAAWQRGPATSSPIGRKSGAMLGSIRALSSALTFSVRVGRRYAWFFQHGAIHRGPPVRGSVGRSGPLRPGERRKRMRTKTKGRERAFQQPRPIVPGNAIPPGWRAPLEAVIDVRLRRDLAL